MVVTGSKGYELNASLKPFKPGSFHVPKPHYKSKLKSMSGGRSMERRSRDKQKEAAATMSNEEDDAKVHKDQDDARQYRCFKKYEEIVKQVLLIDEMTDSMDNRARFQRRRRASHNARGSGATSTSMPEQGNIDGMLAQTITRFLHELNPDAIGPDPKPSDQ